MADRIYVNVSTFVDRTGYVTPQVIHWKDGRKFEIEQIKDFRPADSFRNPTRSDRYTVKVKGETRYLYFEKTGHLFPNTLGRWFVIPME